jgi:sortase A
MEKHRVKIRRPAISTIILILIFLAGLSLLLYPSVSDYINSRIQNNAIRGYEQQTIDAEDSLLDDLWEQATEYNQELAERGSNLTLTEEQKAIYEQMLTLPGGGPMSYIEIPSINCTLPIYHGTDSDVLQVAVGHLEGTSLPVGGESTHCVLSGHRGLPSAKLFTNLDELSVGDIFRLYTLGYTLTYEVDQILIVEPDDTSALRIVEGEDYCTLVTCTPYGVNTQRLLVRGHRVEEEATTLRVTADAMRIEPVLVAPFAAVPILAVILMWVFAGGRVATPSVRRRKRNRKDGTKS